MEKCALCGDEAEAIFAVCAICKRRLCLKCFDNSKANGPLKCQECADKERPDAKSASHGR